jgi:hypothetical protein
VDADDVSQIAVLAKNRAEDVVELGELELFGDRDQADNHRAHLTQNGPQDQAFEGTVSAIRPAYADRWTPDLLTLSPAGIK